MPKHSEHTDASVQSALEQIVDSGQQLVLDRLDLMRIEAREGLERATKSAVLMGISAIVGVGAWVALMVAVILYLREQVPTPTALLLVGVVHAVAGAVLWLLGRRVLHRAKDQAARALSMGEGWTNRTMGAQHSE